MNKYIFNYVVLVLCFLLIDIFLLYIQSSFTILNYFPTITMIGNGTIFALIPYTYLIVKFLFIKKANEEDIVEYINNKKKIIIIVTTINLIATLIESILLNNMFIWIIYTILIACFLLLLKTKQEKEKAIINKNIDDYFKNNKR